MLNIMSQSGHNFAHVTTALLSWHVQNCDLIGASEQKLEQKFVPKISVVNSWWNGLLELEFLIKCVCCLITVIRDLWNISEGCVITLQFCLWFLCHITQVDTDFWDDFSWRGYDMEMLSTFMALSEANPPSLDSFSLRASHADLWCFRLHHTLDKELKQSHIPLTTQTWCVFFMKIFTKYSLIICHCEDFYEIFIDHLSLSAKSLYFILKVLSHCMNWMRLKIKSSSINSMQLPSEVLWLWINQG